MRVLLAFTLTCVALAAGAQELQPGQWRVVTRPLTGLAMPPGVAMRCLTPEEVKDPGKTFAPQVSTVNSDCERTKFELEPGSLTWRLQCKGQLDMDVAGQFVFESPTKYSAIIATKAAMMERVVQESVVTITAERVGDCP